MFKFFPIDTKMPVERGNVKFGIDPTGPSLHLGHMVPLRLAKKMAEKHRLTIVFGTFTAQLGDPSGQDKTRPFLSTEEVKENAGKLEKQVKKFMAEVSWNSFFNGDEFNKWDAKKLINVCSKFSTTRLLSRDAFQKRISCGKPVHLHELMVPLCQGFDSVILKTDIEIGGEDQLFNFQLTRELQESHGLNPEICILMPIINGTDGRKMSKSLGNCIFFDDIPNDVFGKCMSISDETMEQWIPLLTDGIDNNLKIIERKKKLAFEITSQIHGVVEAEKANLNFEQVIQSKEVPKDIKIINVNNVLEAVQLMRNCSKTVARSLIKAGGVSIGGQKVFDENLLISNREVIKIGKRDFAVNEII
jgi:tyrosyl-tRNA synthetase